MCPPHNAEQVVRAFGTTHRRANFKLEGRRVEIERKVKYVAKSYLRTDYLYIALHDISCAITADAKSFLMLDCVYIIATCARSF